MKTAFITGGSTGIGLEMGKHLAVEGYHPVLMARRRENLDKAVQSIEKMGFQADSFAGDITSSETLENVSREMRERYGGIDFLILNAGVVHVDLLTDYDMEEMRQDIEVNLWGTMLAAYHLVPLLKPGSRLLIVSSAFGIVGGAGYSSYCASKAGLINFGDALRRELLHNDISVYVACPGDVETPQYEYEHENRPQWMQSGSTGGSSAIPARTAAARILKKCSGKRFLIFSDPGIFTLYLSLKLLPRRLMNFILDMGLPRPK